MKNGNSLLRLCLGVLGGLLLVAYPVQKVLAIAGTIVLQNNSPCTATNVVWTMRVTAQTGIVGRVADDVNHASANISAGGTNGIYSSSLGPAQSFRAYIFCRAGSQTSQIYLGEVNVTSNSVSTVGFFQDTCYTNPPPCVTNSYSATVRNRYGMTGIAVWNKDGVMMHSEFLAPGGTATYVYNWCLLPTDPNPYLEYGMSYREDAIISDGTTYSASTDTGSANTPNNINPTNTFGGSGTFDATTNGIPANSPPTGMLTNANSATTLTNGGPIIFNSGDTTAARDITLKAGFTKLADQNQSIINGLLMVNASIGGLTNIGGGGTNGVWTNGLTLDQLQSTTNYIGTNIASNAGTNNASVFIGAWTGLDAAGTIGGISAADPSQFSYNLNQTLPGGQALVFEIESALIPNQSVFGIARGLIKWIIVVLTMYAMFQWAEKAMQTLYSARQAQGTNQSILGTSASVPTAMAYAVIITVAMASIPLALAVYFGTQATELVSAGGFLTSAQTNQAWSAANYIIPIGTIIGGFATYCVFRFVIGVPALFIVSTIIRFCFS